MIKGKFHSWDRRWDFDGETQTSAEVVVQRGLHSSGQVVLNDPAHIQYSLMKSFHVTAIATYRLWSCPRGKENCLHTTSYMKLWSCKKSCISIIFRDSFSRFGVSVCCTLHSSCSTVKNTIRLIVLHTSHAGQYIAFAPVMRGKPIPEESLNVMHLQQKIPYGPANVQFPIVSGPIVEETRS